MNIIPVGNNIEDLFFSTPLTTKLLYNFHINFKNVREEHPWLVHYCSYHTGGTLGM